MNNNNKKLEQRIKELEKQVSYLADKLNLNKKHPLGRKKIYAIGEVVVWRGNTPCIGKIERGGESYDFNYKICDTHNSLTYQNLRPATWKEKLRLGNKKIILLEK